MKVACKNKLNLTEAKTLIKSIVSNGGKIDRGYSYDSASLIDSRKRSVTLIFKSNLELKNLIK